MKIQFVPALLLPLLFVSCASSRMADLKHFSVNDLRPSAVGVVEVREKELKEMPLGKERAIAFEQKRQRNLWSFITPANFREPLLPDIGPAELDGALLPPRS